MSLSLSEMYKKPSLSTLPISPDLNHPSESNASLVAPSFLQYPSATCGPLHATSPTSSGPRTLPVSGHTIRTSVTGVGSPQDSGRRS